MESPARQTPEIAETELPFLELHPKVKNLWLVETLITTAILVVVSGLYELYRLIGGRSPLLGIAGLLAGILLVVGLTLAFTLPGLKYRFWRYRLDAEELSLKRGILTRVFTIVPLHRIQHLDVSQNVIEREMDLAKLIVHTAGTRNNIVVVPGLDLPVAEAIRDQLRGYVRDDAV